MRALVALAAAALLVGGCSPVMVDGRNLNGTSWVAVSVAGRVPAPGVVPRLEFDDGRVTGSAGCNTFASDQPVTVVDGRLALPQMLMTLGACVDPEHPDQPHPAMVIEQLFSTALYAADRIALRGDQLVLSGPEGELVFEWRR